MKSHTPLPIEMRKKIRQSIIMMANDGCSATSIVFAHGQIVTPDEAQFLKALEKGHLNLPYVPKSK